VLCGTLQLMHVAKEQESHRLGGMKNVNNGVVRSIAAKCL